MSGKKGMIHYSAEVKQEAVRLFLEGHYSYGMIAEKLQIRKAERIEVVVNEQTNS